MLDFLKGIVVGIGGGAPGLSGRGFRVILGLYQRVIDAIGTLFKDFRKNVKFLLPLVLGVLVGVLLFSKVVDFLLNNFEYQTRWCFLGLIIGTIPLFYDEVKKEGFSNKYYVVMAVALVIGMVLVYGNGGISSTTDPNLPQSVLMGVIYAGSAIIPGVDSAAIMSALGVYVLWVESLANLNFQVLIPAAVGLVIGLLVFSAVMSQLLKHFYTATFSVVFGLFISIIPSVLKSEAGEWLLPAGPGQAVMGIVLALVGFAAAYYLGDIEGNNKKIKKLVGKE